jgi:hypothetical protein
VWQALNNFVEVPGTPNEIIKQMNRLVTLAEEILKDFFLNDESKNVENLSSQMRTGNFFEYRAGLPSPPGPAQQRRLGPANQHQEPLRQNINLKGQSSEILIPFFDIYG